MWPFKKKKEPKSECCHKYKDFDWYAEANYSYENKALDAKIYEPYVCIYCGHRKDVELDSTYRFPLSFESAQETYEEFQKPYLDKIRKKAFIENEIHDMLLVDRAYLEIYEQLHKERFEKNEKSEANLSLPG